MTHQATFPRHPLPLPVWAALVLVLALFAGNRAVAGGDELNAQTCAQHRDQFIASLDENRIQALKKVEVSLRAISEPTEQEHLNWQREQIWDHDERMRATAQQIWRDCMAHVRSLK